VAGEIEKLGRREETGQPRGVSAVSCLVGGNATSNGLTGECEVKGFNNRSEVRNRRLYTKLGLGSEIR